MRFLLSLTLLLAACGDNIHPEVPGMRPDAATVHPPTTPPDHTQIPDDSVEPLDPVGDDGCGDPDDSDCHMHNGHWHCPHTDHYHAGSWHHGH